MTYQPFLIAPLDSGLNTRYDAWLSPNDAVTDGNNFIIRQGKIEKRRGYAEFWDFGNGDSVLAIFQYIDNTNEKELIVIQENNIWSYDYTTPTFNAIAGATLSATDYSYYNSACSSIPDIQPGVYGLSGTDNTRKLCGCYPCQR